MPANVEGLTPTSMSTVPHTSAQPAGPSATFYDFAAEFDFDTGLDFATGFNSATRLDFDMATPYRDGQLHGHQPGESFQT